MIDTLNSNKNFNPNRALRVAVLASTLLLGACVSSVEGKAIERPTGPEALFLEQYVDNNGCLKGSIYDSEKSPVEVYGLINTESEERVLWIVPLSQQFSGLGFLAEDSKLQPLSDFTSSTLAEFDC